MNVKDLKELKRSMYFKKFDERVEMIAEHYNEIKEDKEKIHLELSLKEAINNIDKYTFLSLAMFVVPNLVKAVVSYSNAGVAEEIKAKYEIFAYLSVYLIFAFLIISAVTSYKFYKLYVNVIKDIKEKRIEVKSNIKTITTNVEEIEITYKNN
ncbi:hypothetical protein D7V67_16075 [Clostridium paraputrificum]|uniref:hypothetical protein n=1 Tax=Clostridium paraputrificum TaxID=29363 RepID=UPI000EA1635C|nr:hypothetical protein [Clostridium paraputrificum]RKI45530.1 hypothetical protein D7V67_16075 [Clostridium paraputrificum]